MNEQAIIERVGLETEALRGFGTTEEPYFDRLEDQVDRLLTSIDAAANALGMVLDLQLNERAYVLSIVATIFVPLTFVTGFFGMNFGWMVDQVDTPGRLLAARVRHSDRDSGAVVASLGAPVPHRRPAVAPLIAPPQGSCWTVRGRDSGRSDSVPELQARRHSGSEQ
jgi:CorA-like Mg2+ transporter protein